MSARWLVVVLSAAFVALAACASTPPQLSVTSVEWTPDRSLTGWPHTGSFTFPGAMADGYLSIYFTSTDTVTTCDVVLGGWYTADVVHVDGVRRNLVQVPTGPFLVGKRGRGLLVCDYMNVWGSRAGRTEFDVEVQAAPVGAISPGIVGFPATNTGSIATVPFVLRNVGVVGFRVTGVVIDGSNPQQFRVGANTCITATLAPNASCEGSLLFAPTAVGSSSADVSFMLSSTAAVEGRAWLSVSGTASAAPTTAPPAPYPGLP